VFQTISILRFVRIFLSLSPCAYFKQTTSGSHSESTIPRPSNQTVRRFTSDLHRPLRLLPRVPTWCCYDSRPAGLTTDHEFLLQSPLSYPLKITTTSLVQRYMVSAVDTAPGNYWQTSYFLSIRILHDFILRTCIVNMIMNKDGCPSSGTHRPDDRGSKYLRNVGEHLPDYTELQPWIQPSSYSPQWESQILHDNDEPSGPMKVGEFD
jgi:hypothetical protein